ncbi:hypothetical protein I302_102140 [Kwoniella bestiolae CBS 10118]|uniref:Uncharacterized protein n=1 Tax=Kwoniella bestiolae CBS 10118 TaxID=1296100 RepID=A0A1B9GE85_9TREE|nr:hypothetical protein I302_00829 [Kwoniella bestiolae CBS 10118]OCF29327.1 hypothetical protein I302_00829 [Kwoniella bestiolae CBS 10118]
MTALRSSLNLLGRGTIPKTSIPTRPNRYKFASSSRNHSLSSSSQPDHVRTLLQNQELTEEDAINELRWITQEVREIANRQMAKGRMPEVEEDSIAKIVERRGKGEPIQYILGTTDFGPLTIQLRRPVLIPRPETAHLTSQLSSLILSSIPPLTFRERPTAPLNILDLCSGTGCIGLLLAKLNPLSRVTGIDNSPVAVQLGMINARDLDLGDRVKSKYGNIFKDPSLLLSTHNSEKVEAGDDGRYGLIISNPPYIPYSEYQALPPSVKNYESPSALLGDGLDAKEGKGLKYYQRIAEILPDLLAEEEQLEKKGWKGIPRLALEIGQGQAGDVVEIVRSGGRIKRTEVWRDQYGVERMVVGWSK